LSQIKGGQNIFCDSGITGVQGFMFVNDFIWPKYRCVF
jgi:hypothetical protein